MALTAGYRLGPYEIEGMLGGGGMGEVYKARDTRLDRTVAVKVLAPELATDAAFKARFEREARTISAVNHPHICVLHDIGAHYHCLQIRCGLFERFLAVRETATGGRPRLSNRACLTGIVFGSGVPWQMLHQERGCESGITCWRRLRDCQPKTSGIIATPWCRQRDQGVMRPTSAGAANGTRQRPR